ncbi:MAG: TMEM175 family protein [Sphingopyxis sp.]|nr:TMEM175 family protein [Sphingopyxis sp.]
MVSESESLDTVEPLRRHVARHNYDRLIMLSDGIFAIAATLLALELQPPGRWDGTLINLVTEWARPLFGYVFGFAVVASFWFSHRNIFARLRVADGGVTLLTLILLMLVAMVPGAAALVADFGPSRAIMVYLTLAAAIGIVQLALWAYAAYWRRLLHPDMSAAEAHRMTLAFATFLLATLVLIIANEQGWLPYAGLPVIVLVLALRRVKVRLAG